jgi:hypothetical protein
MCLKGLDSFRADKSRWDLIRVLDLVAASLLGSVVVMAIGNILAAIWPRGGTGAAGVTYGTTWEPIQVGVSWATPLTGALVLGALGLFTLPRRTWVMSVTPAAQTRFDRLLLAVLVISGLTVACALTNVIIEGFWGLLPEWGLYDFGPAAASGVVTVTLGGIAAGLAAIADRTGVLPEEQEDVAEGHETGF